MLTETVFLMVPACTLPIPLIDPSVLFFLRPNLIAAFKEMNDAWGSGSTKALKFLVPPLTSVTFTRAVAISTPENCPSLAVFVLTSFSSTTYYAVAFSGIHALDDFGTSAIYETTPFFHGKLLKSIASKQHVFAFAIGAGF